MKGNDHSTGRDFDLETAPDLSRDGWPEKFAKASVRRGRPPAANPKVSTTLRLSPDVIDHFKAEGRGWQTRIDKALRDWIGKQGAAPTRGHTPHQYWDTHRMRAHGAKDWDTHRNRGVCQCWWRSYLDIKAVDVARTAGDDGLHLAVHK